MSDEDSILATEDIEPGLERTPTVLVLDTSGSMRNSVKDSEGNTRPRIDQLNSGLQIFKEEIEGMVDVKYDVDVGIIEFGGEAVVTQDFSPITDWEPPNLSAGGKTPMGDAIEKASEIIETRKEKYNQDGVPYKRPFVWVLTDGKPTDMNPGDSKWQSVQDTIHTAEDEKKFTTFIMTIGENAETEEVKQLHDRVIQLKSGMFEEYFEFVSSSVQQVSSTEETSEVNISEKAMEYDEIFQVE